jgi:hypothetical protein
MKTGDFVHNHVYEWSEQCLSRLGHPAWLMLWLRGSIIYVWLTKG